MNISPHLLQSLDPVAVDFFIDYWGYHAYKATMTCVKIYNNFDVVYSDLRLEE